MGSTGAKIQLFFYLQHIVPVAGFGLLLAGIVLDDRAHPIIGFIPFRVLGILGYGIYLWHFPVLFSQSWIGWLDRFDPAIQFPAATVFGGATTFGLSLLTWFAIERPWLNRGKILKHQSQVEIGHKKVEIDDFRHLPFHGY
jgi:peptidoglycan/LPS O-acetylase OafA/YrhL